MAGSIPSALFVIQVIVFVLMVIVSVFFYGMFWIKIDPVLGKQDGKPKPFLYMNTVFEHLWEYKRIQIAASKPLTEYRLCMKLLLAQWALIVTWIVLFVTELSTFG